MYYHKRHCKFSFLELMVVIVIITVMIAVSAPRFTTFYKGLKLNQTARQLKLFFTYASTAALNSRRTVRIKYTALKKEFSIEIMRVKSKIADIEENDDGFDYEYERYDEYFVNVDGVFKKINLPEGIILSSAQEMGGMPIGGKIDFDFDIKPIGVENAYKFTLQNEDGDEINIVIMAGSGIAKIFKKDSGYYGE